MRAFDVWAIFGEDDRVRCDELQSGYLMGFGEEASLRMTVTPGAWDNFRRQTAAALNLIVPEDASQPEHVAAVAADVEKQNTTAATVA